VCDTKVISVWICWTRMASMVDKSLVQQAEQANGDFAFVMLETIREYALINCRRAGRRV